MSEIESDDHPLVTWYAMLRRLGGASFAKGDVVLTELGARRFSLGVADGPKPLLVIHEDDADAIGSVEWKSAAMVRNLRGRDWIALSCPDVRAPDSGMPSPVRLRLWIPVAMGRLDAWKGGGSKLVLGYGRPEGSRLVLTAGGERVLPLKND